MEKTKFLRFELSPRNLKIKNILNQDFLTIEIDAISSAYPNRNNSYFTPESLRKAIPSFYNKPILGHFDILKNDFGGHDDGGIAYDSQLDSLYYDYLAPGSEIPLGMIRQEDTVKIVEKNKLNWIVCTSAIWVKYNYKQVKRLLKTGRKKISVEVEILNSHFDEKGIEVIDEFSLMGITILGDDLETGIADAGLKVLDLIDNAIYQKKERCLAFAYQELEKNINNSEDPVKNEGVSEIEMRVKGGEKLLTYEQKRDLLERALLRLMEDSDREHVGIWVADLDETTVYFNLKGVFYAAPYTIDDNNEAFVKLEDMQETMRSWKEFGVEDTEKQTQDPTGANAYSEGKEGMSKECEGCNPDTSSNFEGTEEPKEDPKEDPKEEPKEDPKTEEACKAGMENSDCKMSEEEMNKCMVNVGDTCMSVNDLLCKFIELTSNFEEKTKECNSLNEKCEKLENSIKLEKEKKMEETGSNMIDCEEGLDEQCKNTIKNSLFTAIKEGRFDSLESVEKFTKTEIAVALYDNRKNDKKESFSINLNKNTIVSKNNLDNLSKLKETNNKLKRI